MSFFRTRRTWPGKVASAPGKRHRVRPAYRSLSAGVEQLEDRSMMAVDLIGIGFDVSNATFSPGDAVPVVWQLANQGNDTAFNGFEVDFFLSRDSFITTDDLFVGSRTLPPGFPGFFAISPQFDTIFLPPSSNFIWNGSGTYFLGMIVDPFNNVFESNEFNNFNRGFGFDVDALQISVASAQPDLLGTRLAVNTANLTAGGQIGISFDIANNGLQPAGAFQVSFFLSADSNISASDKLLGTFSSTGLGANSTLSDSKTFTLPSPGDPIYSGGGPLFVGMIIDSGDAVTEGNEFNNSNRGLGLDIGQISVEVPSQIFLEDLPETGIPPGTLLSEYLQQARKYIDGIVAEQKSLRSTVKGVVDMRESVSDLRAISKSLGRIRSMIEPLRTGKKSSVALGGGVVLDRAQLELAERSLVRLLNSLRDLDGTAFVAAQTNGDFEFPASKSALVRAAAADEDPMASLRPVIKSVFDMTNISNLFNKGAEAFKNAEAVAGKFQQDAAAAILGRAGAISTMIGFMGRSGQNETLALLPESLRQDIDVSKESMRKDFWKSLPDIASLGIPVPNAGGKKFLEILQKVKDGGEALVRAYEAVLNKFEEVRTAVRSKLLRGKWKGDLTFRVEVNGIPSFFTDPTSLKFAAQKKGVQTGTFTYLEPRIDPTSGQVVKRTKRTIKFSGSWTSDDDFQGSIKLANGGEFQFNWNFNGTLLGGNLVEGDDSTSFSVRKVG